MRLLIVVTHLLGLGHLSRAAALARGFVRAGHEVVLVSGGPPTSVIDFSGMRLVQLPPVFIKGTDFKTLFSVDGQLADDVLFVERIKILQETIHNFDPEAAIVELYPFGRRQLAEEFTAGLRALKGRCPVFSSVRDVLAPPSTEAKRAGAEEALAAYFSAVLVHGDARILPLETSWPVSRGLEKVLRYTGYVRDVELSSARKIPGGAAEVLVSGGGSAAALPVLHAAVEAARADTRPWRLLVGHGVPEAEFAKLQNSAAGTTVVERVRRDFPALLASCACSVSLAGYNTMLDLAAAGVPAVIVPFDAGGEVEQSLRAKKFAEMGLVSIVPSSELTPDALLQAVNRAVERGHPAERIAMTGVERTVEIVTQEVAVARELADAWRGITRALDRAAAAGQVVRFWWRDDDAVAPTPQLDRLLALAGSHAAPVALAVIPEQATPELALRLAKEPLASVLVHGITHRNNAPEGRKKQELVATQTHIVTMLTNARWRMQALFGEKALPVLVPPWNRIDPELVEALPDMGFAGLSTYADEIPAHGLAVINTHIDPIDWKDGGGLARALAHIRHTEALIDARTGDKSGRPIGLLTHHLVHDPWVWQFVEDWLAHVARHPAAEIVEARVCFGLTETGARAPKV